MQLPELVNWLGHFHPVILHFPIVLIFVTIIQYWRGDKYISLYIGFTTLFTIISAMTGLILSLDGGAKGQLILTHQWMGIGCAFLMVCWYLINEKPNFSKIYIKMIHGGLMVLVVVTGHFGGMITHGKDFLTYGKGEEKDEISMPDDPILYTHIVQPILDKKCVSCHNENKSKGELLLTGFEGLVKGGESGSVINQEDVEASELLHRLLLPTDDEDHMPPEEEDQLSPDELQVLRSWVELGANDTLKYSQLNTEDPLYVIVQSKIKAQQTKQWKDLPEVSDDKIADLSSDYCHIMRIYNQSNALQVLVFPNADYSPKMIEDLKPIAKNIIELDVNNLPLGEKELKTINSFSNIERLNMSNTPIDDAIFRQLGVMEKLAFLQVYSTKLGEGSIEQLLSFPNLKELYLYNTGISAAKIAEMAAKKNDLVIMSESMEAQTFKSVLPPPTLAPEKSLFRDPFYIKLEHPLADINFNYTADGSDPTSDSPLIKNSLLIDKSFTLKYFASKEGWDPSTIDSVVFIKSSRIPDKYTLGNPPNSKYTGYGKSLLFDLKRGPQDDLTSDAWMAFREQAFVLNCEFDQGIALKKIILSSLVNTDPYLFPPSSIRIMGGNDLQHLKLLGSMKPKPLKKRKRRQFAPYTIELNSKTPVKYLKIVAEPLYKIPLWHQGKGERGWFFIDEVVFVE